MANRVPVPLWLRALLIIGALLILLPLVGVIDDPGTAGAMRSAGLVLCVIGGVISVYRSRTARDE